MSEAVSKEHGHDPVVCADIEEQIVADGKSGEVDAAGDALVVLLQHDEQRDRVTYHPDHDDDRQVVPVHFHTDLRRQVPAMVKDTHVHSEGLCAN